MVTCSVSCNRVWVLLWFISPQTHSYTQAERRRENRTHRPRTRWLVLRYCNRFGRSRGSFCEPTTMIDKTETQAYRDQQADARPGPDPLTPCNGCGTKYRVSHFEEHGQLSNDPDERILCEDCSRHHIKHRSVEYRSQENKSIEDYV